MDIPECPITKAPLKDPVVDPEGNTFEKSAILEWLRTHGTSPITRTPLTADQLTPNRALKDLIEQRDLIQSQPNDSNELTFDVSAKIQNDPISSDKIKFEAVTVQSQNSTAFVIEGPDVDDLMYPVHVCCVIDSSGSMGSVVSVPNRSESDGLTILDLVKHSTRVIIESLSAKDQLSIIKFSSDSKCVLKPTIMDSVGKESAKSALANLAPDGSTNLAAGIKHGIDTCGLVDTDYFSAIFVLTDGNPDDPNFDYVSAIKRQKAKKRLFGSLSTFGFGYSLDSDILKNIATEGNGVFGFIPDGGMVGTIFINALANLRTVYAVDGQIEISPDHGVKVNGYFNTNREDNALTIKLSPVRFGQKTVIVVDKPGIEAVLKLNLIAGKTIDIKSTKNATWSNEQQLYETYRSKISNYLFEASATHWQNIENIRRQLIIPAEITTARSSFPPLEAFCVDIEGQVKEALSRADWFTRWGKHYLISLAFAHSRLVCNNFKDPGVQEYGKGKLFKNLKDDLSDMFISLPAPVPSASSYVDHSSSGGSYNVPAVSMSRYYDASVGCFYGAGRVCLSDGSFVQVKDLKKGMKLDNGATVKSLVETRIRSGRVLMAQIGKLLITPYHPVRIGGEWQFPNDSSNLVLCNGTDSVFSVVVDSEHVIKVDGIECVCLGHNFTNPVVKHEFFGSRKVIEALEKCPGWNEGHVLLKDFSFTRDEDKGLVSGIQISPKQTAISM